MHIYVCVAYTHAYAVVASYIAIYTGVLMSRHNYKRKSTKAS